jgi:peptide/nickel transport system permease protein
MVAVLVSLAIITFVLSHVVPANPAAYMAGPGATQSQVASIQHALGLDKPLPEQFLIYMRGLLHLDLGTSIRTRQPVALELWTYLPATLELIFYSFLLYMILGVALGIIAALKRDSWLDVGIRSFVTVATSLPVFWVGLVLQLIFFVNLGWLPIGGRIGVRDRPPPTITGCYTIDALLTGNMPLFFTVAQHLILPVMSITFSLLAVGARLTRATFVEEMDQQYVVTARGKGLPKRRVVFKHILRNALNPILTMSGIQLGYLFSWIVLTVNISTVPWSQMLAMYSKLRTSTHITDFAQSPFTLDPTLFMTAFFQTGGLYNMSKYSNPRVDRLLTRAAQTFSPSAQAHFMDQAQRIVRDQAPCVWGARPRTVDAVPDYVRGYVIDRTDYRWSMKFYLIRILAH